MILRRPISEHGMSLCRKDTGAQLWAGDQLEKDGATVTVTGGAPPRHAASSGRIWIKAHPDFSTTEYFPHVFGCEWTGEWSAKA